MNLTVVYMLFNDVLEWVKNQFGTYLRYFLEDLLGF